MKYLKYFWVVLVLCTTHFFCCSNNKNQLIMKKEIDYSGPPTIIYKTKENFNLYVPVSLSDDKSVIVSYPSTKDVYYKGQLAYPTMLNSGYLLDNRGININSAFLNFTYEEYSQLTKVPSIIELYSKIKDKNPFLELYNCGNRHHFTNEIIEINNLIASGTLHKCKCLIKPIIK